MSAPDFGGALRDRFATFRARAYFATHGFGPLLLQTLADLDDYRRSLALRNRAVETWYGRVLEMRELIAQLIGAGGDEIALGPNATACQASFAAALVPRGARDAIVTTDLDFPSSRYLWRAQVRRGFRIVDVPSRDGIAFPVDDLVAAIDERTAVVTLPLVAYSNGALLDAARIVAAAHAHGALVVLDAYQAAGIVPIDAHALGADALVAGTNKWLSSPSTGLAFLYVARAVAERLEPAFPGWFGHADPLAFADDYVPAPGARRFELGAPAVDAIYGARAGIRFALEVGVPRLHARSQELCDRLIAGADGLGIRLTTPRARAARGGMVCFDLPDPDRVVDDLAARAIDVDTRPGIGMRMSCHPCNSDADCDRLLGAIAELHHARAAS
ncbi:MAG: aminotransferase class V-fold PLP-dependent enzyme [Deltaproteobacteria bacterium]|nr:aminotransferase class V-fold PLP-dependent enzyme [Deltaproteobacteria bacterium]